MNEQTQRGIAALKAGDQAAARQLLQEAVRQAPQDSTAWLWLSGAVESDEERLICLQRVLRLDPNNQHAARGLAQIAARRKQAAAPVEQAAPVEPAAPVEQAAPVEPAAPENQPAVTAPSAEKPTVQVSQAEAAAGPAVQPSEPAVQPSEPAVQLEQPAVLASQPSVLPVTPADNPQPFTARFWPRRRAEPAEDAGERIFRTRPSQVPALASFWVFFIGAFALQQILNAAAVPLEDPSAAADAASAAAEAVAEATASATASLPNFELPLAAVLGLVLEFIVLYVIYSNFKTRYELTTQQLRLPFQGKPAVVPLRDILHFEQRQNFFQRLLGTGDVRLDAVVQGQLAHLRLRDIPDVRQRVEQLRSTLKARA